MQSGEKVSGAVFWRAKAPGAAAADDDDDSGHDHDNGANDIPAKLAPQLFVALLFQFLVNFAKDIAQGAAPQISGKRRTRYRGDETVANPKFRL